MIGVDFSSLFRLLLPETILVVTALLVLSADLTILRKRSIRIRFACGAALACAGLAVTLVSLAYAPDGVYGNGMLRSGAMEHFMQAALVVLAMLTVLLSIESEFTPHVGEFLAIVLLATTGMLVLVSTENVLLLFLALELLSLALYILTAFDKQSLPSAEAALKYCLFGSMSAAFLLFGLSLIYGLTGAISLPAIATAAAGLPPLSQDPLSHDPLMMVATIMIVTGFGFKVAAVPFHLWAPDAYEGAPAPSAGLIASSSKVASFFIFARVVASMPRAAWFPVLVAMAVGSIFIGNFAALAQKNLRRLLAYSAIAHGGYLLLALLAGTRPANSALLYYVLTYALTTLGAFAVIGAIEGTSGPATLSSIAGLSRRAPVLSCCLLVFMLSLAGIPPLAGFMGKFLLFSAVLNAPQRPATMLSLTALAIGASAVSLFYYLRVLKQVYVAEPETGAVPPQASWFTQSVIALIALSVVVLGCFPSLLLSFIERYQQ